MERMEREGLEVVLLALEQMGEGDVAALAASCGMTPSAVARCIGALAVAGWVVPRRYGAAAMTEAGRRHAAELIRRRAVVGRFLAVLRHTDVASCAAEGEAIASRLSDETVAAMEHALTEGERIAEDTEAVQVRHDGSASVQFAERKRV